MAVIAAESSEMMRDGSVFNNPPRFPPSGIDFKPVLIHNEGMTTNTTDIRSGDTVAWLTWTGEEATARVEIVSPYRISTNKLGIYWEATCFSTLAESINRTRGFRVVAM